MEYTKTVWKDLPDTSTPITADKLNNLENGVEYLFEHGVGGGDTLPIGIILPFSNDTIPEGYMLCDGTAISRTTYATLFSIIGTTYGAGDGSTTFNLPNLKGKVPVGYDSTDSDFDTLGETGGEKTHTLTVDEMPAHTHNSGHYIDWYVQGGVQYVVGGNSNELPTSSTGGSQAHNNLQPYQVVNYIIKVLNAQNGEVRSESLPVGTELDFDGTSQDIPTGWEEITNPDSYSTNEVKTNKVWIDNKPIYRKVASFNVSSDSQQVLQINVENVDIIIEGKFILKGSDFCAIDHTHIDSTNNHISKWVFTIHNTDVSTTISKTIENSGIYYVILEYTKTTD